MGPIVFCEGILMSGKRIDRCQRGVLQQDKSICGHLKRCQVTAVLIHHLHHLLPALKPLILPMPDGHVWPDRINDSRRTAFPASLCDGFLQVLQGSDGRIGPQLRESSGIGRVTQPGSGLPGGVFFQGFQGMDPEDQPAKIIRPLRFSVRADRHALRELQRIPDWIIDADRWHDSQVFHAYHDPFFILVGLIADHLQQAEGRTIFIPSE